MSTRHAAGFTLVELIVFVVIVSVGLAGLVSTISGVVKTSADALAPKQAMLVAESMLEEVLLKPYTPPAGGYAAACPGTCERARFDDVGDYAGYTSNGVFALDDMSAPVAGLEGYRVTVNVAPASAGDQGNGEMGLRIDVAVVTGGDTYTLSGYRFNYD